MSAAAPQPGTASVADGAGLLAEVVRGELVESVHLGHLVVLAPSGEPVLTVGDPGAVVYPRSSLKPLQAVAMLRSGLDLPGRLLALAAASHNGEPVHLDGAREILDAAGLGLDALQNTPDLPLHAPSALAWQQAGHGPEPVAQNCSGKHAAMLATCVAAGWDTATYRDPGHPLQRAVADVVRELTGDEAPPHVTVDGCGAPLLSTTLEGLARAFARMATAPEGSAEAQVAAAMSAHPEMVGGTGRDVTDAMRAVPGLFCKDGAEGVYAGALPSGAAFAFKVLDGAGRPRPALLAAVLRAAGALDVPGADAGALDALGTVPVLGHGEPVGEVRVPFAAAVAPGRAAEVRA
ncbi:asparaginase [Xylanimonas oleitrophica]|uniref:Asparaginase n=1 Tax=Xylanimonas oleitrophica TaxID=2607479 RepID=A0A2W5YC62_9MICO|nr:asparaginase [Xylanimonas oleitrophica]PZR51681.1 asparaginase [Xylanimonas oleitrophica]